MTCKTVGPVGLPVSHSCTHPPVLCQDIAPDAGPAPHLPQMGCPDYLTTGSRNGARTGVAPTGDSAYALVLSQQTASGFQVMACCRPLDSGYGQGGDTACQQSVLPAPEAVHAAGPAQVPAAVPFWCARLSSSSACIIRHTLLSPVVAQLCLGPGPYRHQETALRNLLYAEQSASSPAPSLHDCAHLQTDRL